MPWLDEQLVQGNERQEKDQTETIFACDVNRFSRACIPNNEKLRFRLP